MLKMWQPIADATFWHTNGGDCICYSKQDKPNNCRWFNADLEDIMSAPGDKDEHSDDPLSHLDLDGYIAQHLRTIHTSDPAGFEGLCASLTSNQLQTVKAMFS